MGNDRTTGLVYQIHEDTTPDPMGKLVYRVHPIPSALEDFIFDFGSLDENTEKMYIRSMTQSQLPSFEESEHVFVTEVISSSQAYIRRFEKESSAASLRDVQRFCYFNSSYLFITVVIVVVGITY